MDEERSTLSAARTDNAVALAALDTIVIGKSTKADIMAALGKSMALRFDTGFEVWAYRFTDPPRVTPGKTQSKTRSAEPPPQTELAVLFAPSGIATKTRTGSATPVDTD